PNLRVLSELPYQLAGAGRGGDLAATLTAFRFLDTKLRALGPQALLDDFALPRDGVVSETSEALDLVAGVVSRSFAVLVERPTELASQVHARLLGLGGHTVEALLARICRDVR